MIVARRVEGSIWVLARSGYGLGARVKVVKQVGALISFIE